MVGSQITDRTYADTTGVGRGNYGAICLPNCIVIIDSSLYPSVAKRFRTYMEKNTKTPVTNLILTHYHGDHVFGNQIFQDCQIIASHATATRMREAASTQWTREMLEETAKSRPETCGKIDLNTLTITFPNKVFEESYTLTDDGLKIKIIKVGGHTEGTSYIHFPEEQVVFAGDLIFARMFPWGGDPTADPDKWIAALKKFQQINITKIIPGHGPICDLHEVQIYLTFFEEVVKIMKELITDGRSKEEVVRFDGYPEFYASETPSRRKDTLAQWYEVYKAKLNR